MKNPLKRKLQIRFILLSMAALLVLQTAIVTFSIWHSYRDMVSKSDVLISQLRQAPSANSRYFSVKVHPGKGAVRIDTLQNVSVTPAQAGEYARSVLHTQKERGFIDGYRYHVYTDAEGMQILFLSRQSSLEMHHSYSANLILFSVCGLAVMCIALIPLSGIVIAPIVDNHNKQKQFITSASHQLKTPLTVIRTQAQLLQEDTGQNEWITGILGQTDRLTKMTQDMVILSQAEECHNNSAAEVFSLADLAQELAELYTHLAKQKNIKLSTSIPDALNYKGDANEIQQLFSILLDNATKYCTPDGQIHLTVKKELRGVSIRITNTATELDTGSDNLYTQRFFRGENAAGKEGSGLGLSIAQTIAGRHKGKLTVTTGNNTFCVNLMLR